LTNCPLRSVAARAVVARWNSESEVSIVGVGTNSELKLDFVVVVSIAREWSAKDWDTIVVDSEWSVVPDTTDHVDGESDGDTLGVSLRRYSSVENISWVEATESWSSTDGSKTNLTSLARASVWRVAEVHSNKLKNNSESVVGVTVGVTEVVVVVATEIHSLAINNNDGVESWEVATEDAAEPFWLLSRSVAREASTVDVVKKRSEEAEWYIGV